MAQATAQRMGQPDSLAFVTFRDLEYPQIAYGGGGYGESGQQDDWDAHMRLLTPTAYPQACSAALINEANGK